MEHCGHRLILIFFGKDVHLSLLEKSFKNLISVSQLNHLDHSKDRYWLYNIGSQLLLIYNTDARSWHISFIYIPCTVQKILISKVCLMSHCFSLFFSPMLNCNFLTAHRRPYRNLISKEKVSRNVKETHYSCDVSLLLLFFHYNVLPSKRVNKITLI